MQKPGAPARQHKHVTLYEPIKSSSYLIGSKLLTVILVNIDRPAISREKKLLKIIELPSERFQQQAHHNQRAGWFRDLAPGICASKKNMTRGQTASPKLIEVISSFRANYVISLSARASAKGKRSRFRSRRQGEKVKHDSFFFLFFFRGGGLGGGYCSTVSAPRWL